ncbi:MAG TPA: hypothetical protein VKM55_11150 [Candidatus Lokiarchaeia archaeon]|nr:hypothetical protein [Candidatus Lokiarchaeia archaeon]
MAQETGQKEIPMNRGNRISLKDLDIKILVQKIITIIILQFGIYGLFIIIDPGFYDSLRIYFIIVLIGTSALVGWSHVHNVMDELRAEPKKAVLDQTDWTPKK